MGSIPWQYINLESLCQGSDPLFFLLVILMGENKIFLERGVACLCVTLSVQQSLCNFIVKGGNDPARIWTFWGSKTAIARTGHSFHRRSVHYFPTISSRDVVFGGTKVA